MYNLKHSLFYLRKGDLGVLCPPENVNINKYEYYLSGTKINVFDIVATRAPKISDLRARSKFW